MAKKHIDYLQYAFILDLDDTLYKEIDFVHSAFCHIDRLLVADYGFPAGKARRILLEALVDDKNSFDELNANLKMAGIEIPNAIKWMVDEYRYHIPQIYLPDDSYEFLSQLEEREIEMFIITDGRSVTQRNKIRALGLDNFIPPENIFISEEIGKNKINPLSFERIMKRYTDAGIYMMNFVFVGDNPGKDFVVANSYNCPTVMLADDGSNIHRQDIRVPHDYEPRFKVKSLQQILRLLDKGSFASA